MVLFLQDNKYINLYQFLQKNKNLKTLDIFALNNERTKRYYSF